MCFKGYQRTFPEISGSFRNVTGVFQGSQDHSRGIHGVSGALQRYSMGFLSVFNGVSGAFQNCFRVLLGRCSGFHGVSRSLRGSGCVPGVFQVVSGMFHGASDDFRGVTGAFWGYL